MGPSSHYSLNPKLIRKKNKSFETWERLPVCVKAPVMQMRGPDFASLGPRQSLIPSMIIVSQCSKGEAEGRDRSSQAANLASTAHEQERRCQEWSRQRRLAHLRLTYDLYTQAHHVRGVPTVTYMNAHTDVHTLHTHTHKPHTQ